MRSKERKLITPLDIVIIVSIFLISCIFILQFLNSAGKTAIITVDGVEVRRINLDSASDETLTLDTKPVVTLRVSEGTVRFVDSQCPSKTCQHRGELKNPGDVAACVPAGVVVSITDSSNTKNDVDAVVG